MGQYLSDAPRDIATLIFDIGGRVACRWCECSISVSSLKFVGMICHTFSLSISRPGDLDLWLLTLKLVRVIVRRLGNLPINFCFYATFRSQHMHLSDAPSDLATLTFDLGGHAWRWCGSLCFICVSSLKFVGLSIRKIWRTFGDSINRPAGDLVPFIFLTSK